MSHPTLGLHPTLSKGMYSAFAATSESPQSRPCERPGTLSTITKKFKLFPGGYAPPDPPSSRLLSQPPQARFERLSQVGRCRSLQGWEVLGQWFEF